MTIERAIQAFGKGFSFTRSFTAPYEFVPMGSLWHLRDGVKRKYNRREEVIVHGVDPDVAQGIIVGSGAHRPAICAIRAMHEPPELLKAKWKSLGYRLSHREALMVLPLIEVPEFHCSFRIGRVRSESEAEALRQEAGSRQLLPEHLESDDFRVYVAWDGDRPIGWVRSGKCDRDGWVSNMFVRPEMRRQGIGKSLLSVMLQEDRLLGLENSVLLASTAGSKLYPCLGYRQIGELLLFCPSRS